MGWSGVLAVVVALLAATGAGVFWQRRNGKFRGLAPVTAPATAADAAGPSAAHRSGDAQTTGDAPKNADARKPALDGTLAGLGVTADTPITLVQFSSAFCAPCRTTRVLCAEVSALVPGVRHVEVDAESHLEAVRALDIWRTPTVLIVDGQGQVVRRASGAPTRAQLLAAVAEVLPPRTWAPSPAASNVS